MDDNNNNYGGFFGNSAGAVVGVYPVDTSISSVVLPLNFDLFGGNLNNSFNLLGEGLVDSTIESCDYVAELMRIGDKAFFNELPSLAEAMYTIALQETLLFDENESAEQFENPEQVVSCVNALGILYVHTGRVGDAEKFSGMYAEYFDTVFY